ncbi:MAG: winged helix-turn-helix transcriptional regulator [Cyanobacteriota bacterium]
MQEKEQVDIFNRRVLKPPKDEILRIIKKQGGATVDDISQNLALASTSIRQHLAALERDQLVKSMTIRKGAGRPKILYSLTELANNLFPKRYDFLLSMILDEIERIDGAEKVDLIFDNIAGRVYNICQGALEDKTLDEKIETMTSLVRAWGSMAECEKISEKYYVIREYNCDFYNSVLKYNLLSKFALKILQKVLQNAELDCKIETNKSSGVDFCSFYINCN